MTGAVRKSTDNSAGHSCFPPRPPITGSGDVFVNNKAAIRNDGTDKYAVHCCGDSCHDGTATGGSDTVFVNNKRMHRAGDRISCGDVAFGGSGTVFIGAAVGESYLADRTVPYVNYIGTNQQISGREGPALRPGNTPFEFHVFTHDTVEDSAQDPTPPPFTEGTVIPDPIEEDVQAAPTQLPPVQDCSVVDALPANFQWQDECESAQPAVGIPPVAPPCTDDELITFYLQEYAPSFALSTNYSLASLTTSPAVSTYFLNDNMGLSQKSILLNLCFLTKTILEPMLSLFGPFVITSAFRRRSGTSQHNIGQAVDIQFPHYRAIDYWNTAKTIRDNINFDQFILEYGGRNPWFHLSAKSSGHRNAVLTQTAPNTYQTGLIRMV